MIHALLLAPALLTVGALSPTPSPRAQEATRGPAVSHMSVEIWPEYDDPGVLVIYRGSLEDSISLPADFAFVIPSGAQIHMAGAVGAKGEHLHGLYTARERADGLTEISYRLEVPDFYMEFYYDPSPDGERRSFEYPVISPSPVRALVVSVQEPRRASEFQVSPAPQQVVTDDQGFDYHVIERSSMAPETVFPVAVSYTKTDREPSISPDEARMGQDGGTRSRARTILGLSVIVLGGLVAYALFVTTEKKAPKDATPVEGDPLPDGGDAPDPKTPPPTRPKAAAPGPHDARDQHFCTICGQRLGPNDRFCGICGQPSRATLAQARSTPALTDPS